jgi:hypothetical protein
MYVNKMLLLGVFTAASVAACGSDRETSGTTPNANSNNNAANTNNTANNNMVTNNNTPPPPPPPEGLPVLGRATHDYTKVDFSWVSSNADSLDVPRDLAFNPERPMELWVINFGDESTSIFTDLGGSAQTSARFTSNGHDHFLAKPTSMAFGAAGSWASIHEEDDFTQGPNGTPKDFMGPTLWTSVIEDFDSGHGSHLDMLHNSPLGMGIAWEVDNVYWVFDGFHSAISRYDFASDHGLGGADHSDGAIWRYATGQVSRVAGVPSHMEFDHNSNMLYIADTGNNRIARLDTTTGIRGSRITPNYDGVTQYSMDDGMLETFLEGSDFGLMAPSGLAIKDGVLYIGDNATSTIHAFDIETGEHLDFVPVAVSPGGMMGLDLDADGNIYGVDSISQRIFRLRPLPE